jgi:hypothetical protein
MTKLTSEQLNQYEEDGYVVLKGMLSPEQIFLLSRTAREDRVLDQHSFGKADGEGGTVRLSLWNHPTDTIYGVIARSESIVGVAEQVLGGEDAKVGGAWAWHQDYGYWYQNGVLFPDLTSAFIAVDPATRENGCMQVIKGSHKLGRIEHVLAGEQAGADIARVEEVLKVLPLEYVEMDPGDVLYFHANLLHRSDQNRSEKPRWSMISCYNAARNNPYKESHHPRYTPLHKLPDSEIVAAGNKRFAESDESVWLDTKNDVSATSLQQSS